jgi:hypothetical protein
VEYLTENNIQLLILFIAPGFISLKIWGLIHPSPKIALSESLIEAIVFSSFNYIVTIWLYFLINGTRFIWIYLVMVLVMLPIIWPVLLKAVLNNKLLRNKIISPIPKSWDYFFSKRQCCFMLVHLNDRRILGGFYGPDSFASSYPEQEDLYLQEVWQVDSEGKFIKKIPRSRGFLVNYNAIEYIEFFDLNEGEHNG